MCSAQESRMLKNIGQSFNLVTPRHSPVGSGVGDQKRIMTPVDAIEAGSDYLVIGRPITQSPHPPGDSGRDKSNAGALSFLVSALTARRCEI